MTAGSRQWIAALYGGMKAPLHMVVVAGLNSTGRVMIKDPWGPGTTYEMGVSDFLDIVVQAVAPRR